MSAAAKALPQLPRLTVGVIVDRVIGALLCVTRLFYRFCAPLHDNFCNNYVLVGTLLFDFVFNLFSPLRAAGAGHTRYGRCGYTGG